MDTTSYTENYLRLHLLEVKGGTLVLKELFVKIVKNSSAEGDVDKFLANFKNDIRQAKPSTSAEYQMLFPSQLGTDINKWDISLLAYVLIHCCTLKGQLSLKGKKNNPKEILKQEIKDTQSQNLDKFLIDNKGNIDKIKGIDITDKQYEMLYPPNSVSTDINAWDIELLLCILFRFCSGVNLERVRRICKDVVVREVSLCDIGLDLGAFLSKNLSTFAVLKIQGTLSDDQYEQLFPKNSMKSDLCNWDDNVLRIVCVNACQAISTNTQKAVKTIRQLRKELGAHTENTEVDNTKFLAKWSELHFAIYSIITNDVPGILKDVDNATVSLRSGPLDIKASIDSLKYCYQQYNRDNNTVLERLRVFETNMHRDIQDIKQILQDHFVRSNHNATYGEQVEIKCVDLIFVVKGQSLEAVKKAEQIIYKAMEGIEDDDTRKIQSVVIAIMESIRKDGTTIVEIRRGSIILVVRCISLKGVYTFLNTMDSKELHTNIQELATILTEHTGDAIDLACYIPSYSLPVLVDGIRTLDTNTCERSVILRIKPVSLIGLTNLWQTFQDGSIAADFRIVSECLSDQLGNPINVSASLHPAVFREALQTAAQEEFNTHEGQLDTVNDGEAINYNEHDPHGYGKGKGNYETEHDNLEAGDESEGVDNSDEKQEGETVVATIAIEPNLIVDEYEPKQTAVDIKATTSGDQTVEDADKVNVPTKYASDVDNIYTGMIPETCGTSQKPMYEESVVMETEPNEPEAKGHTFGETIDKDKDIQDDLQVQDIVKALKVKQSELEEYVKKIIEDHRKRLGEDIQQSIIKTHKQIIAVKRDLEEKNIYMIMMDKQLEVQLKHISEVDATLRKVNSILDTSRESTPLIKTDMEQIRQSNETIRKLISDGQDKLKAAMTDIGDRLSALTSDHEKTQIRVATIESKNTEMKQRADALESKQPLADSKHISEEGSYKTDVIYNMDTLNARLNQQGYKCWLKSGLVLKELKYGLADYLNDEVRDLHQTILSGIQAGLRPGLVVRCTSCSTASALGKKWTCRSSNICTDIKRALESQHEKGRLLLANTDVSLWTDVSHYWEMGKCFISAGYRDKQTAQETDCSGLLSLVVNCRKIKQKFSLTLTQPDDTFDQIQNLRNEKIMHSADLLLVQADLDDLVKKSLAILQDPMTLLTKKESIDAVQQIRTIHKADFTIALENELQVLGDAVKAVKVKQSEHEEHVKQMIQDHKTEIGAVNTDLKEKKTHKNTMKIKLEAQLKQIAEVDVTLRNINTILDTTRESTQLIKTDMEHIRQKNESIHKLISEEQNKLKAAMADISDRLSALTSDPEKTQIRVATIESKNTEMKQRVDALESNQPLADSKHISEEGTKLFSFKINETLDV